MLLVVLMFMFLIVMGGMLVHYLKDVEEGNAPDARREFRNEINRFRK